MADRFPKIAPQPQNGYDYSFRNSLNKAAMVQQQKTRPREEQDDGYQLPSFRNVAAAELINESPERRKASHEKIMRDSIETFGRRSRSHMNLNPKTTIHNQINRIEINFNGFLTPVKPTICGEHFTSTRSLSSAGKNPKLSPIPMSTTNRNARLPKPMTVEEIYVFRIRDKFIQKSNQHIEKSSPHMIVGLPESFVQPNRSNRRDIVYGRNFNRKQLIERRLRNSRLHTQQ